MAVFYLEVYPRGKKKHFNDHTVVRQCVTWMTRTRVSGYFLNTDSKADAGKRKIVERVAALADTVLYGAG